VVSGEWNLAQIPKSKNQEPKNKIQKSNAKLQKNTVHETEPGFLLGS
jgi:hypothetical protein